jgi:hypothetical protein
VVRDGQRTFEIAVEQQTPHRSLLEGEEASLTDINGQLTSQPTGAITNIDRSRFTSSTESESTTQINKKESAALEDLVDKLRNLRRSFKSEKTDSAPKPEDKAALMDKLISDFKDSRVSTEEARNLGDLGEALKDINNMENDKNSKIER